MWAQLANTFLGLWLMIAPSVLMYNPAGSNSAHMIGPVVITFSITAMWECTRGMRKWNYPLAVWLILAPWILNYDDSLAAANDMALGLLIIVFSSIKGKIENKYGGGWPSLWKSETYQKENQ